MGIVSGRPRLFGIQVIQVTEKLIKAVVGRQELVFVAQVVLAELATGITQRFEQLREGRVFRMRVSLSFSLLIAPCQ